jgi:hypothetical protein
MKYCILEAHYAYDLTQKVEAMMKSGWKCQGGVSYWASGSRDYYKQAMVKE